MDKYAKYPQYKEVDFYISALDEDLECLDRALRHDAQSEANDILGDMCFKVYEAALNLDNIEDIKRVAQHFHSIT